MPKLLQQVVVASTLMLLAFTGAAYAQAPQATSAAPDRYLKINAPYAQQLLVQAKATHPELKKIGLHVVPPGQTESCIIANPIPSKIGKISSPRDLTVVASGQPKVYPHAEEGGFFDLGLPMSDAANRPIGLMVMEIPFKGGGHQRRGAQDGSQDPRRDCSAYPGQAGAISSRPLMRHSKRGPWDLLVSMHLNLSGVSQ